MSFREKLLSWEQLPEWRQTQRRQGRHVVVASGCFDLLHLGHATYLEASRKLGDLLLVGVNSDASVRRLKGPTRPINNETDRALVLAALASVDAVCIFDETTAERFLERANPDTWVKGADYTLETLNQTERRMVEQGGGTIAFIPFVAGRSTTTTLSRIGNQ